MEKDGLALMYCVYSVAPYRYYMGTTVTTDRPDCVKDPSSEPIMNSSSRRVGLAWSYSIEEGREDWHRLGSADSEDSSGYSAAHACMHLAATDASFSHSLPRSLSFSLSLALCVCVFFF